MADKEQIKINGVVYYKQQDINKGLDEEHYITEFHLLATHYNLLLEDYARKAQECERKDKEIDELKQECEKLKEKLYQIEDVVKPINEQLPEDAVIRQIMLILNDCNGLESSRYLKALEEIEKIANVLITETNEYSKCCHKNMCGESDVSKHKKIEKTVACPYGNVAYCQYEAVDNILTIIKELKGE